MAAARRIDFLKGAEYLVIPRDFGAASVRGMLAIRATSFASVELFEDGDRNWCHRLCESDARL